MISTQYGIPVVSHGGSPFGYKSDMTFLPPWYWRGDTDKLRHGGFLTRFFLRRLLEVLFDGKPEALEQAKAANAQRTRDHRQES